MIGCISRLSATLCSSLGKAKREILISRSRSWCRTGNKSISSISAAAAGATALYPAAPVVRPPVFPFLLLWRVERCSGVNFCSPLGSGGRSVSWIRHHKTSSVCPCSYPGNGVSFSLTLSVLWDPLLANTVAALRRNLVHTVSHGSCNSYIKSFQAAKEGWVILPSKRSRVSISGYWVLVCSILFKLVMKEEINPSAVNLNFSPNCSKHQLQ